MHPISDGLTGDELRTCMSCLLHAVERHDETGDTGSLLTGVLATTRLAERLAHSVPDDSNWTEINSNG